MIYGSRTIANILLIFTELPILLLAYSCNRVDMRGYRSDHSLPVTNIDVFIHLNALTCNASTSLDPDKTPPYQTNTDNIFPISLQHNQVNTYTIFVREEYYFTNGFNDFSTR